MFSTEHIPKVYDDLKGLMALKSLNSKLKSYIHNNKNKLFEIALLVDFNILKDNYELFDSIPEDQMNIIINQKQNEYLRSKDLHTGITLDTHNIFESYKNLFPDFLHDVINEGNIIFGNDILSDFLNNEKMISIQNNKINVNWSIYLKTKLKITVHGECNNDAYMHKHNNITFIFVNRIFDKYTVRNYEDGFVDDNIIHYSPYYFYKIKKGLDASKEYNFDNYERQKVVKISAQETFRNFTTLTTNITCSYRNCYVCKKKYMLYYKNKNMCISCGCINEEKNNDKCDLTGKIAFVTGVRHTLGYEIVLKLLRMNCVVYGTTRFPSCALLNYQQESDYDLWKNNLTLIQCDFLDYDSVAKTIDFVKKNPPHIFINNACQTIKPTPKYYQTVGKIEQELSKEICDKKQICEKINNERVMTIKNSSQLTQYATENEWKIVIPSDIKLTKPVDMKINWLKNVVDDDLDKNNNTWTSDITNVSVAETLEAVVINQTIPALMIQEMVKIMKKKENVIIQVTSKEGIFSLNRVAFRGSHPHTNMCKAGANMFMKTLMEWNVVDYSFYCQDVGYCSGLIEDPDHYPLSSKEGAQRAIDPVVQFFKGKKIPCGLYKDYLLHDW